MSKIGYELRDNWDQFNYNSRFLDALAALYHCRSSCAAILEYDSKFYLSYSNSTKAASKEDNQNKKRIELIKKVFSNNLVQDDILGIYLTLNIDFLDLVKKTRGHVDEEAKVLLIGFRDKIQGTKELIDKQINKILINSELPLQDYLNGIVPAYFGILDHLANNLTLNTHLNTFLRPLQDASKLFVYFNSNNNYQEFEIILLDNEEGLHAEYNIIRHFPRTDCLDKNYIGISKLSCGYCHKSLGDDGHGYLHRGTHGVCDDEWVMSSPQEGRFKASVEEIAEFVLRPQHRKLSTDEELERGLDQLNAFKMRLVHEVEETKDDLPITGNVGDNTQFDQL